MGVKWGIIGTANIAKKLRRAIALAENSELIAIASRSQKKAKLRTAGTSIL